MNATGTSGASRDRDRGEAVTQLVILTPVLVLLVFLGVQAAIYFHAANVAAAAAAQGAAAASPRSAGSADGSSAAAMMIDDLGGDPAATTTVRDDGAAVSVTVTIVVHRVLPFFPSSVSRTASEPKERFVPESER